ncbi:MAG: carboxypeptidase M32 [Deltaproteobacteria bacterium CG_4_10_14_0_2_um_filter_43_8]|nr:MAG: carboxypeptidase M32 [Deltaproteobacteria bacterium CG11_big_fil_rev_8_21_14_0_20_42_23]PJA18797.1 MAG: carboxypeptidase M32 [Deltaproteobacteria bacterium CG_4_10_14_0_2_um_filter_43_8]PJC63328.1 MAG: carboxypeptidase M32 [Deltaproteobacteria bacterium CG_4_9_14_0_2_um_filter_42_21]
MSKTYERLEKYFKEVSAIAGARSLLGWDQETMMPPKGAKARAEQISVLSTMIHRKVVEVQVGDWISAAAEENLSETQAANVKAWKRDYEKATKLPESLVRELSKQTSLAQQDWARARQESSFSVFSPSLENIVLLCQQKAKCLGFESEPYDALLDTYEAHMTTKRFAQFADEVKAEVVPLFAAIQKSKVKPDSSFLQQTYPKAEQEKACRLIMKTFGLDLDACRLDTSTHPFCGGPATNDVRITTRYDEKELFQALYGVAHEAGHALYEQGFEEEYEGTPMAEAISLGIHESQSRLWENLVGRSKAFVHFFLPQLQTLFPNQLSQVKEEAFYAALNKVEASPIRVEADELTYNLHIVLRFELERALIADEMKVADLPHEWNARMKNYLGITPKNDAEGVLQDIHWSFGGFGYFPTYMLGNIYGSQMWKKIEQDIPSLKTDITAETLSTLLSWLRKNVHRRGRQYFAADLVENISGEPLSAKFFTSYLKEKFGALYEV